MVRVNGGYRRKAPPRRLTENDYGMFEEAAAARPQRPRTKQDVQHEIKITNRLRYWRLKRDLKWFRKQAARRGVNGEEALWLLP